jgi:hypothetical protein
MRTKSLKALSRGILLTMTLLLPAETLFGQDTPLPTHYVPLTPVSCFAVPSNNPRYIGYYVGGGCACLPRRHPRRVDEGTWGWDYQGSLILRLVNLGWWHGRRYQGGTGAYNADGPHYHEQEGVETVHRAH